MKLSESSIRQLAQKFNLTPEEVKQIVNFSPGVKDQIQSIDEIFSRFPEASTHQKEQAQLIFAYSPSSAFRYLQACENYRLKKQNESTRIRYNRKKHRSQQ